MQSQTSDVANQRTMKQKKKKKKRKKLHDGRQRKASYHRRVVEEVE
jgi:hypothetical protein